MTCTGCETRIENALKKLDGMEDAKAIFSSSNVYVTYDVNRLGLDQIIETIEKLDYKVKYKPSNKAASAAATSVPAGDGETGRSNTGYMIGTVIILFSLYIIIKNTVGFNFIPQVDQSMGYGILFAVGLLTSIHCIAMCGGINLSVSMAKPGRADQPRTQERAKDAAIGRPLLPGALYNLGRVISYTLVGGLVGALGSAVSFSGAAKGVVAVISGVFMVIMGLNMLNIFPWLRKINPRMPKFLGNKVHGSAGNKGPLIVGLLNGLMPCGPLQAMQLYALGTGSFTAGALSMLVFSLGTVPLMFGFSAASSFLSGKFTHKMIKVSAVLVIFLGVIMLNRGLNLSGFGMVFAAGSGPSGASNIAKIGNNIQTVEIQLRAGGYSPITVQKGIPVRWNIKADRSDLNGCNNAIVIPEYRIQKILEPGDNIIEFTPQKEGYVVYTCWMGMIGSSINVVADITKVTGQDATAAGGIYRLAPDGGAGQSPPGGCCRPRQAY